MHPPPYIYSAFSLTVASDIILDELLPGAGHPDVVLRVKNGGVRTSACDDWSVDASPGHAFGTAPAAGRFEVTGGEEIVLETFPDADDRAVRLAVVGPLLGVILAQRGRFVLHASTVVVNGEAVAFAGPSGRGKSTLAAAMADAGHALIADDMTVIDLSGGVPVVQPGFPRVKLWPDSATALNRDVEQLPLLHPDRSKRSVAAGAFANSPVPLNRCYLLEDGEADEIRDPESGSATMLTLVQYTYQSSWMHETGVSGANLLNCGALARSGVVRTLRRRRSFETLPAVITMIEADALNAINQRRDRDLPRSS